MAYTSFMRGDNTKMANTPYTDGLIFLNTEEQALYLDDNNERIPMGGAGTGGHIIENNAGTDMTERTNLQFGGVYVSDDETNDRTKVNVTRNMTKDAFDQLTTAEKLGVIVTSNDPNDYIPFSADMVEYDNTNSGMTATDVQDAIDELNSDITDANAEILNINTDLTIDLSNTSLPSTTDFNSLIQMMAENLYPMILNFKDFQSSLWDVLGGTASFQPLRLVTTNSTSTSGYYSASVRTKKLYDFSKASQLKVTVDSSVSTAGSDVTIDLYNANNQRIAHFYWNTTVDATYSKTFDISSYNGTYKLLVSIGNGYNSICQFSRLIAE